MRIKVLFTGAIFFAVAQGVFAQMNPTWGTLVKLDMAEAVVFGTMVEDDSKTGNGIINVETWLKGSGKSARIKVKSSGPPVDRGYTKSAEPPRYVYGVGFKGVWVLTKRDPEGRFNLCAPSLYYSEKWRPWVVQKLTALQTRKWSGSVNGLTGSVIVDNAGENSSYRFFHLCVKNISEKAMILNVNPRHPTGEAEKPALFQMNVKAPGGMDFDIARGYHEGKDFGDMGGEPGWLLAQNDFKTLLPGEKMILPFYGTPRYFSLNPSPGTFQLRTIYQNVQIGKSFGFQGVWTGRLVFPTAEFSFKE